MTDVVPKIIELLKIDHQYMQNMAVEALGKLSNEKVVTEIIKLLKSYNSSVQRVAVLSSFGMHRGIETSGCLGIQFSGLIGFPWSFGITEWAISCGGMIVPSDGWSKMIYFDFVGVACHCASNQKVGMTH